MAAGDDVASVQRLLKGDAVCYWAATMQDASGPELRHEVVVGVVVSALAQPEETAIFVVRGGSAIKVAIPIGAETELRVLSGAEGTGAGLCEVRGCGRCFVYEGQRADVETLAIAFNKASKCACDNKMSADDRHHFQWVRVHTQGKEAARTAASEEEEDDDETSCGGSSSNNNGGGALTSTDIMCIERTLRREEREHCTYKTIS